MKRILIAESGASKTAWRCCQDGQLIRAWDSPGLNPNTLSEPELRARLAAALPPLTEADRPSALYFYGAGLQQATRRELMTRLLRHLLPAGTHLEVQHDLLAAVRATGWSQGMVAILGTGSNACRFEGARIVAQRGGLGYLLGDEGSGTDLSRAWLRAILTESLPPLVIQRSLAALQRPPAVLLREVYQTERPAAFLANLMPHLTPLLDERPLRDLVRQRFLAFLDQTVCQFDGHTTLPLAVVGSVGFHLQAVLLEACKQRQLEVPLILAAPIDGLVHHHLRQQAAP